MYRRHIGELHRNLWEKVALIFFMKKFLKITSYSYSTKYLENPSSWLKTLCCHNSEISSSQMLFARTISLYEQNLKEKLSLRVPNSL